MLKQKEIFTQTRMLERITFKHTSTERPVSAMCSTCRRVVNWLSVGEVSAVIGQDVNGIRDLISVGELDIQIGSESLSICAESVRRIISMRSNDL